jgi:ABC-2 type transport system permease protein
MLLGGVTVPVTLLPDWIEPLSRAVFLYWSGNLLRDSFAAGAVDDLLLRLGALFLIGVIGALFGGWLVTRMLDHHKREGTLSL